MNESKQKSPASLINKIRTRFAARKLGWQSQFSAYITSLQGLGRVIKTFTYSSNKNVLNRDLRSKHLPANYLELIRIHDSEEFYTDEGYVMTYNVITKADLKIASSKKFIIYCHGLNCAAASGYKHAVEYVKSGYNVVTFTQRGYDQNPGFTTLSEKEKDDVLSIIKEIKRKYEINEIILHGESMGAATVLNYGIHYDSFKYVSAYIVDSSFSRLDEIFKYWQDRLAVAHKLILPREKWTMKTEMGDNFLFRINFLKYVADIKAPILFIHSFGDKVIPVYMSKNLYNSRGNEKENTLLWLTHGYTHVHSFLHPNFYKVILTFLEKDLRGWIEEPLNG